MLKPSTSFLFLFTPLAAIAQQAVYEVPGLFGECLPIYASAGQTLTLYQSPDLDSERMVIPYGEGWNIPYIKSERLTRVISFGEVELLSDQNLLSCEPLPEGGQTQLSAGERLTYMYYLGEGMAKVLFGDSVCGMDIIDARVLAFPDVQPWIKVLYRDGSSPGWLSNDGSQTTVAGLRC
ncbi:MAG: hypothetical protein MRY76_06545 [Pseudomonadales bacterium]|nr:hypothetical protein [Pseudomonadales bacterium]